MDVRKSAHALLVTLLCTALAASVVACGRPEETNRDDQFIFASSLRPRNFDPIFNDDGETFRVLGQMYETLISHRPGTARLAPGLAEDWELLDEGKTIVFSLRRHVSFHDGTPFNAQAVCYNFDRWFQMSSAATQSNMYYYGSVWGGFKENLVEELGDPLYSACEARDDYTAVLRLNRYTGALPAALTLPAFAISSPKALRKYNADTVSVKGETYTFSEYAMSHPTGTGPFALEKYDSRSGTVTLRRFDDYWGSKAELSHVVFRFLPQESERKKQLLDGQIDGYDFPSPASYKELEKAACKVLVRPAFNLLYLGINQSNVGKLADVKVRKAIAHAINRQRLVERLLPKGSSVATQFMPDSVSGYASDLHGYEYNPELARQLLEEANAENLTLRFYYPTSADRPYMPNPADIFAAISADLKAVGITIEGVGEEWEQYLKSVREEGKHDLHLLGWTGDYNDPGNFVGSFFSSAKPEFGYNERDMFNAVSSADAVADPQAHIEAYQRLNHDLMNTWLPAVPLSHSPPAVVVGPRVRGLSVSPMTDEHFSAVYKDS